MLNLPTALRIEKNKLTATAPWLVLLTITIPDADAVYLVRNTDDVTCGGQLYPAYAFELGESKSSGDSKVSTVNLRVANPARAFQPLLEAHDGLIGQSVTIKVVHADNLSEDYADLTLTYTILASTPDAEWIDFQLGAENPMRRRFPLYNSLPRSCPWIFKGAECAYGGGDTACARTLDDCKAKSNAAHFGGRPGVIGAPRFVSS